MYHNEIQYDWRVFYFLFYFLIYTIGILLKYLGDPDEEMS